METKLSKLAVSSLILGIIGFLSPLAGVIALILGVAALIKIKGSMGSLKGSGLAISGVIIGIISLVLLFFAIGFRDHYKPFRFPTAAMQPSIKENEKIIVDRKAYINNLPKRGDIIVFELNYHDKKTFMCKRIVGLPDEKLEIKDGNIFIGGNLMQIPGLVTSVLYKNGGDFGKAGESFEIPNDSYYVLGDNPSKSQDSRYFGVIHKNNIFGKVILTYGNNLPFQQMFELFNKK